MWGQPSYQIYVKVCGRDLQEKLWLSYIRLIGDHITFIVAVYIRTSGRTFDRGDERRALVPGEHIQGESYNIRGYNLVSYPTCIPIGVYPYMEDLQWMQRCTTTARLNLFSKLATVSITSPLQWKV